MNMSVRSSKCGRIFIATVVFAAFFWTLVLSGLPQLHGRIHTDANRPNHACAVTLIATGSYEHAAHRPQQTLYFPTFHAREPDFVVDVTPFIERRREAVIAFQSQFHDPASAEPETVLSQRNFLQVIESRLRGFGALIGVEFGEGFVARRPPRIDDPVKAFEGFEPGF